VGVLHSHGSLPHPIQRPAAPRFLALRMDGVSDTNFAQCLYFPLPERVLGLSGIDKDYHQSVRGLLRTGDFTLCAASAAYRSRIVNVRSMDFRDRVGLYPA
jgi:hypothetical protein